MREYVANPKLTIPLGRQGEDGAVLVKFPICDWERTYGSGSFELLNMRPTEKTPYTCSITADDNYIYWIIQAADVAIVGHGKCELTYVVDGNVAKSLMFGTCVLKSIEGSGEVPPAYESRIQDLILASANITTEANRAETAREGAEEAQQASETAKGKAEEAQQAAEDAQDRAEDARDRAEDAQQASEDARDRAEDAQQASEDARDRAEDAQQASEDARDRAEAAQGAIENLTVTAETLPTGSSATAQKTVDPQTGIANIEFGIPKGDDYVLTEEDREDIAELIKDDTDIFQEETGLSIEQILTVIRDCVQIISNFVEYTGDTELSDTSTMWVQNKVIKAAIDVINEALNGKQGTLTFDEVPTQNSTNPVKSGGVFSAIKTLADAIKAGTEETAEYHLGFYLDENGDLTQVDDE